MWYVARGIKKVGPIDEDILIKNWYSGKVLNSDLVFSKETGKWERFDECICFGYLFPKVPESVSKKVEVEIPVVNLGKSIDSFVFAGWIFACLAWILFPIIFATISCCIGVYNIVRKDNTKSHRHGWFQIGVAFMGIFVNLLVTQMYVDYKMNETKQELMHILNN